MNTSPRGKFITVEGPDGAGKTTNLTYIESKLNEKNITWHTTREPGGTELGERVRDLLLNQADLSVCDEAEALLMFAARAQHIHEVIEPTLAQGHWVLCDRFTDATYAYQGAGRQLGFDRIKLLERWVHSELTPDLTIVFDIDVAVGEARIGNSLENSPLADPPRRDRFESAHVQFKERVRQGYQKLQQIHPTRIYIVDTDRDYTKIHQDVGQLLDEKLFAHTTDRQHVPS